MGQALAGSKDVVFDLSKGTGLEDGQIVSLFVIQRCVISTDSEVRSKLKSSPQEGLTPPTTRCSHTSQTLLKGLSTLWQVPIAHPPSHSRVSNDGVEEMTRVICVGHSVRLVLGIYG